MLLNWMAIFIDDRFLVTLTDTLHLAPVSCLIWIYDWIWIHWLLLLLGVCHDWLVISLTGIADPYMLLLSFNCFLRSASLVLCVLSETGKIVSSQWLILVLIDLDDRFEATVLSFGSNLIGHVYHVTWASWLTFPIFESHILSRRFCRHKFLLELLLSQIKVSCLFIIYSIAFVNSCRIINRGIIASPIAKSFLSEIVKVIVTIVICSMILLSLIERKSTLHWTVVIMLLNNNLRSIHVRDCDRIIQTTSSMLLAGIITCTNRCPWSALFSHRCRLWWLFEHWLFQIAAVFTLQLDFCVDLLGHNLTSWTLLRAFSLIWHALIWVISRVGGRRILILLRVLLWWLWCCLIWEV